MTNEKIRRVVVIAPTRSTCLNISIVLQNGAIPATLLMQEKGGEIFEAVDRLNEGGFGVVAGTGTGKTVAIRDIAQRVLTEDLRVDIVTREHEATEYTWTCNVLVITPGVALHWLKSGTIGSQDLIVIDEIHQTSEHLELAMALAKRAGCTFVWMSATIEPTVYADYLNARKVITCSAFDPSRRSTVSCECVEVEHFLARKVQEIIDQRRAVAVFVPTRALAEKLARDYGQYDGLHADFYHGGERVEKLRVFLKGEVERPFIVFMTIAGASSLNILGLDTVVIVDSMFKDVLHSSVKVFEQVRLGNNELLQMGGRVNGRAVNSQIHILTSRTIDFHALQPTAPEFVLGGDLERVALTCARLEINASELDLIGKIDHAKYEAYVKRFRDRGVIEKDGDGLTAYGKVVERLPVTPAWAEMLVRVQEEQSAELFNTVVVCACVESLYGLMRKNCDLHEVRVRGSDHLASYNIVANALQKFGRIHTNGEVEYRFSGDYVRKDFDKVTRQTTTEKGVFAAWCDDNLFSGKAIKEAVLAMKSVYRQLHMRLPETEWFAPVQADDEVAQKFADLLARVQSLDFVQCEYNSQAGQVWKAQHSSTIGQHILGVIRFWSDRRGYRRASIEGTEIPFEVVEKYASQRFLSFTGMTHDGERLVGNFAKSFAGEALKTSSQEMATVEIPADRRGEAQECFVHWLASQMV